MGLACDAEHIRRRDTLGKTSHNPLKLGRYENEMVIHIYLYPCAEVASPDFSVSTTPYVVIAE